MQNSGGMFQFAIFTHGGSFAITFDRVPWDPESRDCALRARDLVPRFHPALTCRANMFRFCGASPWILHSAGSSENSPSGLMSSRSSGAGLVAAWIITADSETSALAADYSKMSPRAEFIADRLPP